MARFTEGDRSKIDQTAERWERTCLLGDESLVFDGRHDVWSPDNVEDLYERFNGNQLAGDAAGGRFVSKWDEQLNGASDDVKLLGAEVLLMHFLFVDSVTRRGKFNVLTRSLEGTGIELPIDAIAVQAMSQGIGHPGIGFNTRRDVQVAYLIDFVRRLKVLSDPERRAVLATESTLREFADDTDWPIREMRHVLLHLLRPEYYERISSGTHKREIAHAFSGLLPDGISDDVDEQLWAIRQELEKYIPGGNTSKGTVDFYYEPLRGVWESSGGATAGGVGDLEALEWKKQIVLYGPPGTSKTWQAESLAKAVIRRAALAQWGPQGYFSNAAAVEAAMDTNIFRLQLHPGFGYEQFIRGLRLEGSVTRYRTGFLPWVVDTLATQQQPGRLEALPGVLILDEINRTNLTEMLGEAFSLLERDQRGKKRELPGFDAGQEPDVLVIPENLYVIGTMNEIDQSVETLDFALRRRFLWRECPFERETLLSIVADRWDRDVQRHSYDDAAEQLEKFADRAQALNRAIEESDELGRQYQVGHTYFADIAFFLGPWVRARKNRPSKGTYLWTSNGAVQPPLDDLWSRSLEPLLAQYLAGSDVQTEELKAFKRTFLSRD